METHKGSTIDRHQCVGKRGTEAYHAVIEARERGLLREQGDSRDGKSELTYSAVVPHESGDCEKWLEIRNKLKKTGAVAVLSLLESGVFHVKLKTSGGRPDAGFFIPAADRGLSDAEIDERSAAWCPAEAHRLRATRGQERGGGGTML